MFPRLRYFATQSLSAATIPTPKGRLWLRRPLRDANGRGTERPCLVGPRRPRDLIGRRTIPPSGRPGHGEARGPGAGLRVRVADGVAAVASVRDPVADGAAAARGNDAGLVLVAGGDDRPAGGDEQGLPPVDGASHCAWATSSWGAAASGRFFASATAASSLTRVFLSSSEATTMPSSRRPMMCSWMSAKNAPSE